MDTIQNPKKVKARKEHECNFCRKKIEKGEYYTVAVYKDDEIYSWKSCSRCEKYVEEIFATEDYDCDGLSEYDFVEHMRENYSDIAKEWGL